MIVLTWLLILIPLIVFFQAVCFTSSGATSSPRASRSLTDTEN